MSHTARIFTFIVLLTLTPGAFAQTKGPALWMVKGPRATVYLFGRVHVLQKDKPWRTAGIDAAIANSGSLWLEIPDADDTQSIQKLVMKLGVDQAHPLSTHLTTAQTATLDAVIKSSGVPAGETALEPLRPWLAAVTLSTIPIAKAGFDPASGVEQAIKPEFLKQSSRFTDLRRRKSNSTSSTICRRRLKSITLLRGTWGMKRVLIPYSIRNSARNFPACMTT